jgi:hypothetical protein
MNKEILSQQIADLEAKLAELKAEVNKPAPITSYWQPKKGDIFFMSILGEIIRTQRLRMILLIVIEYSKPKKKHKHTLNI